jgi:hypothetical protein
MKTRTRISGALATLLISWSSIYPTYALTKRDDGDEPGTLMSAADAVLIFAGIPLAVTAVLALLIWVPGRSGSKSSEISNY